MILRENFSEEHIRELQLKTKADPVIIERTLYAFGLLEALVRVGLPFIFKGGTSLILLLNKPGRLSTDIDIIVEPEINIEFYIAEASKLFPFKDMHEQKRMGRNNIVKRHFRFTYDSPVRGDQLYILLDVVFEKDHYRNVLERPIKNELILTEGKDLQVKVPSVDCMLGDKLTAFAPHTCGVRLHDGKDMEVIKQYYDVYSLINEYQNFEDVRETYLAISETELAYRGIDVGSEDSLLDTIRSAICIGSRGKVDREDYAAYVQGTRKIMNHLFERNFSAEVAKRMAPKIIYMAACILMDHPFEKELDIERFRTEELTQEDLKVMKDFRKERTDGYGYLVLADRLLRKFRIE